MFTTRESPAKYYFKSFFFLQSFSKNPKFIQSLSKVSPYVEVIFLSENTSKCQQNFPYGC
jgi:hypothetical protein